MRILRGFIFGAVFTAATGLGMQDRAFWIVIVTFALIDAFAGLTRAGEPESHPTAVGYRTDHKE